MSSDGEVLPTGSIRLRGVSKSFDRASRKPWSLARPWGEPGFRKEVVALQDLDLDIAPGEAVGLIGRNGAGKSTILKLLAGVADPTQGTVECVGTIGSMIELGLGFHPELTGRENARGTATILGLTPEQADDAMPSIMEFAAIEDAMDTPMKHYSTGMRARLGFAVSVHVPRDILLIDEVLAVGDDEFQMRCVDRIAEMQEKGTTLLFVSHATWLVASVCDRVVQVRRGRIVDDGPSEEVIRRYLSPQPVKLAPADSPTMRFRSFEIREPRVRPFDSIEFDTEVEVTGETPEPAIAIDLNYASLAPDYTIASTSVSLPDELRRPGTFRLHGTTSGLPLDSGHVQVRVALVDESSQRVLDHSESELWIEGVVTRKHPQIALDVEYAVERVEDEDEDARGDEIAPTAPAMTGIPSSRLGGAGRDRPRVVECRGVQKRYHAGLRKGGVRAALPNEMMHAERTGEVIALDGVDLEVQAGESLGIIGPNGSGKSTILKAIAGVIAPTSGTVVTRGRIVSMLELGIGFHQALTGEENIRQTAGLLGMSKGQVDAQFDAILAFADLGEAMYAPVRQYSSGMRARLGMALALHANPEIVLIDEVLAVGDLQFQRKAIRAIRDLVDDGVSALFVSHELRLVEEVCDRVVRLERGRVIDEGPALDVVERAGGASAEWGVTQLTTPVRVSRLTLGARQINSGGRLDFEGEIEVFEPSPTVRVEFAYAARDGSPKWQSEERLKAAEVFNQILIPAGGPLSEVGRYHFRGWVPDNPLLGELFVIVSAIDEREALVTARAWRDLSIGTRIQMEVLTLPIGVEWTVVEDTSTRPASAGQMP